MEVYGTPAQASNPKPFIFDGKFLIPQEIVDDVICRFLLNIPKEEKFDPIRVCFQIELAHWFFLDYYCGEGCDPSLAHLHNMPYNQFAYIMFQKTPHLRSRLPEIEKHLTEFKEYKMRVPTFGAILLDQSLTKVVLVQGFRNHWGFPKGKVNQMEEPVSCAIREVFEETGYDIGPLVNENHFIESKVFERNDRLYLVRGVDPNFPFQPQTMFEIKNIRWFNINELPESKKDTNPAISRHGVPISYFYSVYPYIRRLKLWVADKLEGKNKIQNYKVRVDDAENQKPSSSIALQKSKSADQAIKQQGKVLIPFQFPQQQQSQRQLTPGNITLAGGWKLFPSGSDQYNSINSNALQELLFGQSHNPKQPASSEATATTTTTTSKPSGKGARRRLFTEESPSTMAGSGSRQYSKAVGGCTNQKGGDGTGTHRQSSPHRNSRSSNTHAQAQNEQGRQQQQQHQNKTKSNKNYFSSFSAPAWVDFSFDRERVYKAFFTPPLK